MPTEEGYCIDDICVDPNVEFGYLQAGLERALSSFDVAIEFDAGISVEDRLEGLYIVLNAVRGYASAFANEGLNWDDMMGVTEIIVKNTANLSGDVDSPIYGWNSVYGEYGTDNRIPLVTGDGTPIFTITLAIGVLLSEDGTGARDDQEGINLIAHELGHNLTQQGYEYGRSIRYGDERAFGVNARSKVTFEEYNADAFASWALGSWGDNISDEVISTLRTDIGGAIVDHYEELSQGN